MLCLECGHLNSLGEKVCQKCSRILPERTAPPVLREYLDKITQEAQKLKHREISSGEFRNLLNMLEEKFKNTLAETEKMISSGEAMEEMKEEIALGTGGIKLYIEALMELHRYLDSREEVFLSRGLAMAADANNRLNAALRMNWEQNRNMQEVVEEFLRSRSNI